jgi:hypothetical protein
MQCGAMYFTNTADNLIRSIPLAMFVVESDTIIALCPNMSLTSVNTFVCKNNNVTVRVQ